ncbi:MAG TPA: chromosomal replication initiator protein DnaA [Candidatus Anoxymicrobiaceae bacterium]
MEQNIVVDEEAGRADAEAHWQEALRKVRSEVPAPYFDSMISPLRMLSFVGDTCTVAVPNSFMKEIITARYADKITRALSSVLGSEANVVLTVSTSAPIVQSMAMRVQEPEAKAPAPHPAPRKKYTFENFVVGDSNKFAYNAALMVAELPGHNYNPLFIYGGTGLGKTHLLYAIQDYAENMTPHIKVKYVQTSRFIDEFIATLTLKRDKATFDQKYINNKIVLFDDIQALSGTDATQNKFFDIFNLLYSANSHIVLSSDRPPSEIPQLSDRIRSRFEGGLMIDITPPDLETRLAILRMKARLEKVEIPNDVLVFIASKVKDNIRTLEGLLNRVIGYAQLYGTRIDLPMVQSVLKNQVAAAHQSKAPTLDLIESLVSSYYSIAIADLAGKSRSRPLVHARQVAMFLCREMTDETLVAVGRKFGGRDHATVLHSCRKIESLIKNKREILQEVTELTNMVNKAV